MITVVCAVLVTLVLHAHITTTDVSAFFFERVVGSARADAEDCACNQRATGQADAGPAYGLQAFGGTSQLFVALLDERIGRALLFCAQLWIGGAAGTRTE